MERSGELFNRFGIEAVSIGMISESLEMSTGNVTYYFKKKADLVKAHIGNYETLLLNEVDNFPIISSPRRFSLAYVKLLELSLRYRFLFVGSAYIIQNDLVEATRYKELVQTTKKTFIRQIKRLIAKEYMKPIQLPYTAEMLVENIWRQWLGWMLVTQIDPTTSPRAEKKQVTDAVLQIMFLAHHYVAPDFFEAVQRELKKIERQTPPIKRVLTTSA